MARISGISMTALTVNGTNQSANFDSGRITLTNQIEDGAGAAERWQSNIATTYNWEVSGTMFVPLATTFMASAGATAATSCTASLTITYTSGHSYTGTGAIVRARHVMNSGLQMEEFTIKGRTALGHS